jgi:hypothetical protein
MAIVLRAGTAPATPLGGRDDAAPGADAGPAAEAERHHARRLRRARKHEAYVLRRIQRANEAGRVEEARGLTRLFLKSQSARLVAADEANRRLKPSRRLSRPELLRALPAADPWSRAPMAARAWHVPKRTGGTRLVVDFDFIARVRQRLVAKAIRANFTPHPGQANIAGRGQATAIRQLRDHVIHEKHCWIVSADVRGFFDALDHEGLQRFLPLPQAVTARSVTTANTMIVGRREAPSFEPRRGEAALDGRRSGHPLPDQAIPRGPHGSTGMPHYALLSAAHRRRSLQGVPQGSGASAAVADCVVAHALATLPAGIGVSNWADDLRLSTRTRREAHDACNALRDAFERHPAGPLRLRDVAVRRAADGFEFLSCRLRKRAGDLHVEPSSTAWWDFYRKMLQKVHRDLVADDDQLTGARRYVRAWGEAFPCWPLAVHAIRFWLGQLDRLEHALMPPPTPPPRRGGIQRMAGRRR